MRLRGCPTSATFLRRDTPTMDNAAHRSRTRRPLVTLLCLTLASNTAAVIRLPASRGLCPTTSAAAVHSRAAVFFCQSELEWRRQQSEAGGLASEPSEAEEAAPESGATAGYVGSVYSESLQTAARTKGGKLPPNLSTSVDDMNFFGATGGGQLTRENIQNAQKTLSPRINAMDALSAACKEKSPSAERLSELIGDAYQVGVAVDA